MSKNIERKNIQPIVKKTLRLAAGAFLYFAAFSGIAHAEEDFVLNNVTGMFHEESGSGVASFIQRMESQGRKNVLASEHVLALHNRKQAPPSYSITIDDGRAEHMDILNVLARLNRRATFFVMARWNGDRIHKYMTDEDKIRIAHSDNELGGHTDNHPKNLPGMFFNNHGGFLQEVIGSKEYLEKLTGKPILVFAYPYGAIPGEDGLDIISNHYLGAYTTVEGSLHTLSQANRLPRFSVN